MTKRKTPESLDSTEHLYGEAEHAHKQNATKTNRKTPKNTEEREVDGRPKFAKKPKIELTDTESGPPVHQNSEGEGYIDLGKKKRASVRSFKGHVLVDIREYYGQDDDEKPGKKGISLSLEQYKTLKDNLNKIDSLIANLP